MVYFIFLQSAIKYDGVTKETVVTGGTLQVIQGDSKSGLN